MVETPQSQPWKSVWPPAKVSTGAACLKIVELWSKPSDSKAEGDGKSSMGRSRASSGGSGKYGYNDKDEGIASDK
jgi:hypothetical protein